MELFPKNKTDQARKLTFYSLTMLAAIGAGLYCAWRFQNLAGKQTFPDLLNNQIKSEAQGIDPRIKEFGLEIPKLSLLVPVIKDVNGENKTAYNKALNDGVAHYKGTAVPGQNSNIFIFGHSSTLLNQGQYAKIFEKLNDLETNDMASVYYQGKKYNYIFRKKEIINKDEVDVLKPTKTEQLTLMTCWPIGTNVKRIVAVFDLVSAQ